MPGGRLVAARGAFGAAAARPLSLSLSVSLSVSLFVSLSLSLARSLARSLAARRILNIKAPRGHHTTTVYAYAILHGRVICVSPAHRG